MFDYNWTQGLKPRFLLLAFDGESQTNTNNKHGYVVYFRTYMSYSISCSYCTIIAVS